ncbi:MAG: transporter substrate-binding domain-containing protein [Eubacteriaceae bacterium]|nr:transporter substrate-binding domain-containing protein [Eubacteriaceae bacterium]
MKRKLYLVLAAITLVAFVAGCGNNNSNNNSNTNQGGSGGEEGAMLEVLRAGVKSDVPNFGIYDPETDTYSGLEIDLAHMLAKELTGDETKVEFTAVTAQTRTPLLDNEDLDVIIATFTITEERKLVHNFSTAYYEDAVGLLVKKDAGIESLEDCDGKIIGVAMSATSEDAIQAAADELGVNVTFEAFSTYPEIKAALDSGRVDIFSVDKSILRGYMDDTTAILDDAFSPQQYGVATKLANKEVADKIEELITQWLNDGTLQELIDKHQI